MMSVTSSVSRSRSPWPAASPSSRCWSRAPPCPPRSNSPENWRPSPISTASPSAPTPISTMTWTAWCTGSSHWWQSVPGVPTRNGRYEAMGVSFLRRNRYAFSDATSDRRNKASRRVDPAGTSPAARIHPVISRPTCQGPRFLMNTPTTLAELFARADPKHDAVILPESGAVTTYRALADNIESLASSLRQSGLKPGDPVAIVLPNGLEYLVVFLAVTRARLVAAPLNSAYKADEFQFYLEDSGARAVIGPAEAHTAQAPARALNLPVWSASRDSKGAV